MTVTRLDVEYSNVEKHGQGWDLDKVAALTLDALLDGLDDPRTFRVRIRVHHDTSYPSQSRAKAEVWAAADLSWHETATVLPAVWAEFTAPEAPGTDGLWAAEAELMARTIAVLDAEGGSR